MRDISSFKYGHQNFFLDYERSTQGLLISGQNLKIANRQTQWLARLDMPEKKLKLPFLPILLLATLIFFGSPLDPLGTFQPPKIFLILFNKKCPLELNRDLRAEKWAKTKKIHISPKQGSWDPIFGVVDPGPHTYNISQVGKVS